jgi:outer membrane receptor protein involved in Fe transport
VLTAGVDLWQRDLDSRRERFNRTTKQIVGERPVPASSFLSVGLFAQDEWNIDHDEWVLVAGGRVDGIRVRNRETWNPEYVTIAGILQQPTPNQTRIWSSREVWNRSWSANIGTRYRIAPSLHATLSVAAAFRAPSLEERYQFIDLGSLVRIGDPELMPERSRAWNIGLRYRTDIIRAQIDAYVNDLTNLVTDMPGTFDGREAVIKTNIGSARIHGGEAQLEYSIARNTAIRASAWIVRGEDLRRHAHLPQIPPLTGRLDVTTAIPECGSISFVVTSAATQDRVMEGERRTDGYAVIAAEVVSVPIETSICRITISGSVQNLFNRSYRQHLSTLRGAVTDEPGRNFVVGIDGSFGD